MYIIQDLILKIEVRENNSYIYFKEIMGLGGYPVNTQKRVINVKWWTRFASRWFLSLKRY